MGGGSVRDRFDLLSRGDGAAQDAVDEPWQALAAEQLRKLDCLVDGDFDRERYHAGTDTRTVRAAGSSDRLLTSGAAARPAPAAGSPGRASRWRGSADQLARVCLDIRANGPWTYSRSSGSPASSRSMTANRPGRRPADGAPGQPRTAPETPGSGRGGDWSSRAGRAGRLPAGTPSRRLTAPFPGTSTIRPSRRYRLENVVSSGSSVMRCASRDWPLNGRSAWRRGPDSMWLPT